MSVLSFGAISYNVEVVMDVIFMVSVARRNLAHEKSKVAVSIGGIVLSVFLILTMVGLNEAFSTMMDDMITGADADLWITSEGASGSFHSPSLLPISIQDNLTQIEGVSEVSPLIRTPLSVKINDEKVLLYLNGYDIETGLGGPWSVIEGKSEVENGEIIIDRTLAQKQGLEVGGNLTIAEKDFRIVGLSDRTNLMIAYMVFMTFDDAKTFLLEGVTNYFLVKVDSGYTLAEVINNIESSLTDVSANTSTDTAQAYKDEILGGFIPIFYLLSTIGLLVGIQVIGVLLYSLTMDKAKEYGILKAVGATNPQIYRIVLEQALIVSILGFVIGSIVVPPLISIMQIYVPEFLVTITPNMMLGVSLLGILTGIVASVIPVKKIAGIDPALVFKEA